MTERLILLTGSWALQVRAVVAGAIARNLRQCVDRPAMLRYEDIMPDVAAIYHRTKEVNIYPIEGDRFLIEAFLQDEVHDVHAEIEILHPSLEIVAARSEVRNGPFTNVCNMTHPNVERLVGMRVARGFTGEARKVVGGPGGCHRVSELLVEIAQAAYQLHFVRLFHSVSEEQRAREDVPAERHAFVINNIPGMRNTCFSYSDSSRTIVAEKAEPLRLRGQQMPIRRMAGEGTRPERLE